LTYFATSDTKERIFRVVFVPDRERIIWCAIRHADSPGALSDFTEVLKDERFTVLTALNRVQRHQGTNWFEVIVSKTAWARDEGLPETERQEQVATVLLKSGLIDRESLFFNPSDADTVMRQGQGEGKIRPRMLKRAIGLEEWLASKEEHLEELENEKEGQEDLARRIKALKRGISAVRAASGLGRPKIFISIQFTKKNLDRVREAERSCSEMEVDLEVSYGYRERKIVREEVLSSIRGCTHFIGVWTPWTKEEEELSDRPSPWCLWEVGVANTLGLPFAVLIEKGTQADDFKVLHGQEFYHSFEKERTDSFRDAFEAALAQVLGQRVKRK